MPEEQKYIKTKVWNPDEQNQARPDERQFAPLDSAVQNEPRSSKITPAQFMQYNKANNQRLDKLRQQYSEGEGQQEQQVKFADFVQQTPFAPIVEEGTQKGNTAVNLASGTLHAIMGNMMVPLTAAEGVVNKLPYGKDVTEGVNRAMNLPFDIANKGSELTNKFFNMVGIKLPNIGSPETDKKLGSLAREGMVLYLMGKGHGEIKNYLEKKYPEIKNIEVPNENQNQETGSVSSEQGKPSEQPAADETKGGTPQRESQGVNQKEAPQAPARVEPTETPTPADVPRETGLKSRETGIVEAKPVEEHLTTEQLHNLPDPIKEKFQETADFLKSEIKGAKVDRTGAFARRENVGQGEEVTNVQKSTTTNWFPEWFSELGRSKEDIINGLEKIIQDNGKDKGKLVESLKSVILDRLKGNQEDIVRTGTSGKFKRESLGKIPEDTELTEFLNRFKKDVTLDDLHKEYDKYNKEASFNPEEFSSEKPDQAPSEEVPKGEPQLSGIAQRIREERADVTSMKASEIGQGYSPEEEIQRGKDLVKQGVDPDQVIADFKKDKKISDDTMSVVRVKADELAHQTNLIADEKGINSPEYKESLKKEEDFLNEVKPMQTLWSNIGKAQQGGVEIDTGTFNGLRRAFKEKSGKEFTENQATVAKEFSDRIKALTEKEAESNKRFTDLKDKYDNLQNKLERKISDQKTIRASSKVLANKIRVAKIHRPGAFYSATPASLAWDLGVETVAKSIELGGEIGQAISDGIKALKETDWYKGLGKEKQSEAEKQFTDWHKDQFSKKVEDFDFADKKGNKFTPNEAKAVWDHAKKEYIDKGTTDFDDMVDGVSKDTGLSKEQVRNAIAQPKALRDITDEIYKARYARSRAQANAKAWVKAQGTPQVVRFLKSVPNIFFGLKVFGHGTVGMITHAGSEIYRPSGWNKYFPNFIKQFKLAYGSEAGYEKAISDLQDDPNYIFWKRAGLAVDPTRIYDDYMEIGKYFGKLGEVGNRGFQILKIHRLETAKSIYEHLSDVEKADPNTAKEIAKIVNHSTGTSNVITPKTLNMAFFAPRLEASRWARLIVEPVKALKTFGTWSSAAPAEKVAAKLVAKRSGEMLGTGVAMLAANQAILSLAGSNQKINFSDPTKGDWLRFKAGDKVIDPSGGMLSTAQFIGKLINVALGSPKKLMGRAEQEEDTAAKLGMKYIRGKLSPFIGTAVDFAFHHTYMGDVMPTSNDKPGKYNEKLTWTKYLLENQTPIPVAEGIQDVIRQMKDKGMSAPQIKEILTGIGLSAISGGTGARVREDYKPKSSGVRP